MMDHPDDHGDTELDLAAPLETVNDGCGGNALLREIQKRARRCSRRGGAMTIISFSSGNSKRAALAGFHFDRQEACAGKILRKNT